MTGDRSTSDRSRRARIETSCESERDARSVARAIRPDNTEQMETRVENDRVVTEIGRETTGGLQATVDDYVVNLGVAVQLTTEDGDPSTRQNTTDT